MADQEKSPDRSLTGASSQTASAATPRSQTAGPKTQGSPRAPDAIVRDITDERVQLARAFDDLRGDLGEAIEAAGNRATDAARRAMAVVPVVAVAATVTVGGLFGGALALRRHRRRR